jgi:transposase
MSVRAIQARVECDRATLEHLWRTHRVFNERVPVVLSWLFKMRRGECGRTEEEKRLYRTIADFVLANSQNAEAILNAVSIPNWTPTSARKLKAKTVLSDGTEKVSTGMDWADKAAELSAAGRLLFDKREMLFDLPGTLRQMVCRDAGAIISGHEELVAVWKKAHADWLKAKADWESQEENKLYLNLRPEFEAFEQAAGGRAAKRRGRWHLYLKWLKDHPRLGGWRGGEPIVNELSEQARRRIQKAKPWKQRSVEGEEFWRANPELAALDRLHGYYEREFIRRRKTKKNPDGFTHPPTFTVPHAVRHPRWFVFNAPQTSPIGYRNLVLPPHAGPEGTVELRLLTGDKTDGKHPGNWVKVRFRADPRLSDFRPAKRTRSFNRGRNKGQTTQSDAYEYFDHHLGLMRSAEIKGLKLIFRFNPDDSLRAAYLYFTCDVGSIPFTERTRAIQWTETGEVTKKGKKRKTKKLPDGLIACAVDLGLRHLGFATRARYAGANPEILRSRNLWLGREEQKGRHPGRLSPGADLRHIAHHKRNIRRLRRLRGKPVKSESSHVELQTHIDHMGEDRFKQGARAIINFALNVKKGPDTRTGEVHPRADVLILEKLAGLLPDAEKERGINRALVAWNRGQLVKRVKEMAQDVGLKVFEVSPVGTSQVCSRCGALGRRYSIVPDDRTGRPGFRFGWVEKLFACPNPDCRYRGNADHNASVNLHRRFMLEDAAVKAFLDWRAKTKKEQEEVLRRIEKALCADLLRMHGLEEPTPF